jgi:lysophospholipase L1-like esterase
MGRQLLLSSLAICLSLGLTACSSSDSGSSKGSVKYLGLGDSIAYGENGFVPYTVDARPNGDAFVGYPDLIGKEDFGGQYANLGCPGATTDSYLSLDGVDNGCRDFQKDWLNTMHVQYTTAEADKADEELTMNDVRLVTLSIGGNDLLLTLANCAAQNPDDSQATLACALKDVPTTISNGASNLGKIIQRIQDAGFKGQFIYVNLYSTYLATDSATLAVSAWNNALAPVVTKAGGSVADVFSAFADAANSAGGDPCAAGLLIPNPDSTAMPPCDIHPSAQGARLLADTIKATPGYAP